MCGRQKQEDFWVRGQPGLQRNPVSKKPKKKKSIKGSRSLHEYIFFSTGMTSVGTEWHGSYSWDRASRHKSRQELIAAVVDRRFFCIIMYIFYIPSLRNALPVNINDSMIIHRQHEWMTVSQALWHKEARWFGESMLKLPTILKMEGA